MIKGGRYFSKPERCMQETVDSGRYSSFWKMLILVSLNITHGERSASATNSENVFLEHNYNLLFGTMLVKSHTKIVWCITWECCVELLDSGFSFSFWWAFCHIFPQNLNFHLKFLAYTIKKKNLKNTDWSSIVLLNFSWTPLAGRYQFQQVSRVLK